VSTRDPQTTALTPDHYRLMAAAAARKVGLDEGLFVAQIEQESGFDLDVITGRRKSSAGALGIAQIMPATAKGWGVDPLDPLAALTAAAKHMVGYLQQYGGDEAKALAAYNAGPGNVAKYGGVPPFAETQTYVSTILAKRGKTSGSASTSSSSPAAAAVDTAKGWGSSLLAPLFKGWTTALVYIALIVGGAALAGLGLKRMTGHGAPA
jgi:hypothetical protein